MSLFGRLSTFSSAAEYRNQLRFVDQSVPDPQLLDFSTSPAISTTTTSLFISSMGRRSLGNDPLDEAIKPPPDESPQAREARLAKEENAKRVSHAIDESLKAERQVMKKRRVVRLLLLGQSESGKDLHLL